eukprot:s490_g15.t1
MSSIPGRAKTAKVRKGLTSIFNFVPFYLDWYVSDAGAFSVLNDLRVNGESPPRLIYLDTDTVIMGDLGELQDRGVWTRELGFNDYNPKACIANRGLLVIDAKRWKELQITQSIETWMRRFADSKRILWKSGMSQPPWLLAMKDDFLDLGDEWNCNSLGRDKMPYAEALFLRDNGFDHAAVRKIGAVFSDDGGVDPYVVTSPQTSSVAKLYQREREGEWQERMCSDKGKMLHFNGGVKPWTWQTYYADHKLPLCALPENMPENFNFNSVVQVKLFCKQWPQIRGTVQKEWPEEPTWIANMGEKVAKEEEERIDREKARIQKQELQKEELKARAESQARQLIISIHMYYALHAKILRVGELAAAAEAREREADMEREQLERAEQEILPKPSYFLAMDTLDTSSTQQRKVGAEWLLGAEVSQKAEAQKVEKLVGLLSIRFDPQTEALEMIGLSDQLESAEMLIQAHLDYREVYEEMQQEHGALTQSFQALDDEYRMRKGKGKGHPTRQYRARTPPPTAKMIAMGRLQKPAHRDEDVDWRGSKNRVNSSSRSSALRTERVGAVGVRGAGAASKEGGQEVQEVQEVLQVPQGQEGNGRNCEVNEIPATEMMDEQELLPDARETEPHTDTPELDEETESDNAVPSFLFDSSP